jgi:hypothetical protein
MYSQLLILFVIKLFLECEETFEFSLNYIDILQY